MSFNADVDDSLPWRFKPTQRSVKVRAGPGGAGVGVMCKAGSTVAVNCARVAFRLAWQLSNVRLPACPRPRPHTHTQVHPGQSTLAFYTAHNTSDKAITGISTYNVAPQQVGAYFNKIQCFCFEVRLRGSMNARVRALKRGGGSGACSPTSAGPSHTHAVLFPPPPLLPRPSRPAGAEAAAGGDDRHARFLLPGS